MDRVFLKKVIDFMRNDFNKLCSSEQEEFKHLLNKIVLTLNTKVIENHHGSHYENCVWSKLENRCGPDNCGCVSPSALQTILEQIMEQCHSNFNPFVTPEDLEVKKKAENALLFYSCEMSDSDHIKLWLLVEEMNELLKIPSNCFDCASCSKNNYQDNRLRLKELINEIKWLVA